MNNVGGSNNYGHISDRALRYFKNLGCKTMLDIGCGIGLNVSYASEVLGYDAWGIEGDPNCEPIVKNYVLHDFENDGFLDKTKMPHKEFDLVYCVVVSEHIEHSANAQFMDALSLGKYVLFTWCEPGYPGYHHVNCQFPDYWIPKFEALGYKYSISKTKKIKNKNLYMVKKPYWRDNSLNRKNIFKPYLRDWGMVFIR
jgi:SAM-dependent methyltransferase